MAATLTRAVGWQRRAATSRLSTQPIAIMMSLPFTLIGVFLALLLSKLLGIIEPAKQSDLLNVVVGSLGLAGAILLAAVACGLVLGGMLFWIRSRSA